jgi:tetratricopeptide (TPR) repeat protein
MAIYSVRGYDDEGAIYLRQATQLAIECGAAHIASTCLCELGYVEALAGRRPAAADLLVSALESSRDNGEGLAAIHGTIAFNLVDWGKVDEGLSHYERSLDHARTAGNRRREIWSLGLGGWGLVAASRLDEACAWLENCLACCDDIRWLAFRPWPLTVLAVARLRLQHDPASIRTGLEDAFALSCQLGDPCWEAAAGRAIALTYAATDENEIAMQWLANARKTLVRVTDPYAGLLVEILSDQVRVSLKSGQPEQAASIARELLAVAARTHADAHLKQALAAIDSAKK